jgi:hypothetical protein
VVVAPDEAGLALDEIAGKDADGSPDALVVTAPWVL